MIGIFELIILLGMGLFFAVVIAIILILRSQRRKKAAANSPYSMP
jgi:hypothetical protein